MPSMCGLINGCSLSLRIFTTNRVPSIINFDFQSQCDQHSSGSLALVRLPLPPYYCRTYNKAVRGEACRREDLGDLNPLIKLSLSVSSVRDGRIHGCRSVLGSPVRCSSHCASGDARRPETSRVLCVRQPFCSCTDARPGTASCLVVVSGVVRAREHLASLSRPAPAQ